MILQRLICRVFSHSWLDPWAVKPTIFATQCLRCYRTVTGSWDVMEAIHAWKHYR